MLLGLNRQRTIPGTFIATTWENVLLIARGRHLVEVVLSSMATLGDGCIGPLDVSAVKKLHSLFTHLLNF
jgi:hypothetical protein